MSGIISDNLGRSGGLIKAVAAAGGNFVHLVTQSFSSTLTTFSWDSTYITTTYDTYLIVWQMRDACDTCSNDLRMSSNDGSSWSTGYSDQQSINGAATSVNHTKGYMQFSQGSGNAANEYSQGSFWLCNPMSSTFNTSVIAQSFTMNASGQSDNVIGAGMNNTNAQDNAILFGAGGFSQDMESGEFTLFGVKRS
jgi:hypothetical protein